MVGYVFQSLDVVDIPAYSGKPINTQVILDTAGVIQDAYVLEHHEPILLIGIPEEKLHGFSARYKGIKVTQRVVVGRSSDTSAVTVDAIAGATVTATDSVCAPPPWMTPRSGDTSPKSRPKARVT